MPPHGTAPPPLRTRSRRSNPSPMPACPGVAGPCRLLVFWSVVADHATIPANGPGQEGHADSTTQPADLDRPDRRRRRPGLGVTPPRPLVAGLRGVLRWGHALGSGGLPR